MWILNFLWALFILEIVPQTAPDGETSLEQAREEGHIATVPLSDVIKANYPKWEWVATAIRIFIAISVTVSFFALGSGFKHLLDGFVNSLKTHPRFLLMSRRPSSLRALSLSLYAIGFGIVLFIAIVSPKGFLHILDTYTSLALNLESGVFLAIMVYTARKLDLFSPIPIDLSSLSPHIHLWGMAAYFSIACVYDVISYTIKLSS